jgi:glycopeptide antibiotics resistance protein
VQDRSRFVPAPIVGGAPYNPRVVRELYLGSIFLSVLWVAAIALVVSGVVVAVSRQCGADRDSIAARLVMVWCIAALAVVAILTLQPRASGFRAARPSQFNPISRVDVHDALPNVVLFLPVGFFAAFLWRSKSRPVVWVTAFAFSVSFTVELAQWVLPINRASSIHDVLFNTLGGFIGALAGTFVARLVRESG